MILGLALALVLSAQAVRAERPQGLLWNRSGLPATIPLQVKTGGGSDFLLQLREVGSQTTILAAYIRGGQFFRVLVPAGRFELLFASGPEWRGETALFGPDTEQFILDPPLTFRVTASRRNGHLIDLRNLDDITIRDFAICQRLALDLDGPLDGLAESAEEPMLQRLRDGYVHPPTFTVYPWRFETRSTVCN